MSRRKLAVSIPAGLAVLLAAGKLTPQACADEVAGVVGALAEEEATAAAEGLATYYGMAASASSYGGYGGTDSKAQAKYTFRYPAGWKVDVINKVDKGTNGTDCRVVNPAVRGEKAYVVTLNGVPKLGPIADVIGSVATSDATLQDALLIAEPEAKLLAERTGPNGQLFYDYDIDAGASHWLCTITATAGKLYAMFVTAPASAWTRDEVALRKVWRSFGTTSFADSIAKFGPEVNNPRYFGKDKDIGA